MSIPGENRFLTQTCVALPNRDVLYTWIWLGIQYCDTQMEWGLFWAPGWHQLCSAVSHLRVGTRKVLSGEKTGEKGGETTQRRTRTRWTRVRSRRLLLSKCKWDRHKYKRGCNSCYIRGLYMNLCCFVGTNLFQLVRTSLDRFKLVRTSLKRFKLLQGSSNRPIGGWIRNSGAVGGRGSNCSSLSKRISHKIYAYTK